MNLLVPEEKPTFKKLFTLKPKQKDGLILSICPNVRKSAKKRFIYSEFTENAEVLASVDNEGCLFFVDFSRNKSWTLAKLAQSSSAIKWSSLKENELLIGNTCGLIIIIDIHNGLVTGELLGHQTAVTSISLMNYLCLSSTGCEAIIWDLRINTKLHVLNNPDNQCGFREVFFVAQKAWVLAHFNDSLIQIWKYNGFEYLAELRPHLWSNGVVKSLDFSRNGLTLIIAYHPANLAVIHTKTWNLIRTINLIEIQTVKQIGFVPEANDGGHNKILAILSCQGSINFFNLETNRIVNQLSAASTINRFSLGIKAELIGCILCSGQINIYETTQYFGNLVVETEEIPTVCKSGGPLLKTFPEKAILAREQMKHMLGHEKLEAILRQYGEYPDSHRPKIWEYLLELPLNRNLYNAIIDRRIIKSFADLAQKYPMEDRKSLKNLRKLLDNLVAWCPFFAHVYFLPFFIFPFVKVFNNNPLVCFEAACTIIMNWCQFWFEYFPLPPINILAIIENIFLEHDCQLLDHLIKNGVTSKLYAWSCLENAFSEALTSSQWKIFWDHVLTNGPPFLLCAPVAYNILLKKSLLLVKGLKNFEWFYRSQAAVDVKKLIRKCYYILEFTSNKNHPKLYLSPVRKLETGEYPEFCNYPKTLIDYQARKLNSLQVNLDAIQEQEVELLKRRLERMEKEKSLEIQNEEKTRVLEMQHLIQQKLLQEQCQVNENHNKLENLRKQIMDEEEQILKLTNLKFSRGKNREKLLESAIDDLELSQANSNNGKTENRLLKQLENILRLRNVIENVSESTKTSTETIESLSKNLSQEMSTVQTIAKDGEQLEILSIAAGIDIVDTLIKKIEAQLENSKPNDMNSKISELKQETNQLNEEVGGLIELLKSLKSCQSFGE